MVPFFFTLAQLGYTQRLRGPFHLSTSQSSHSCFWFHTVLLSTQQQHQPPTNLNVTLNDQTRLEDSKVKILPTDSGV